MVYHYLYIFLFTLSGSLFAKTTIQKLSRQINRLSHLNQSMVRSCPLGDKDNSIDDRIWRDAGFSNATVSILDISNIYQSDFNRYTHSVDLTLVNLKGAGWDKELLKKTLERVAEVYKQCGIKVNNPKYVETDPPYSRVDISEEKNHDAALAKLLPSPSRPTLFFIRSNIEGKTGFAWPKDFADPPIQNTAFITAEVNTSEYKEKRQKGYSPTAHELAHIFGNCEHIEGKDYNILSKYYDRVSSDITKAQCDSFKRSNLVKEIPDA